MKFYFTFGMGQVNRRCYHVIEAADAEAARDRMLEKFGREWSNQYESAEAAGVEKFNLKEIK